MIEIRSRGNAYNPFDAELDDFDHVGTSLVKKAVKTISYSYMEGVNLIKLEL